MFHVKPFLLIIFFIPIISFSQHFGTTRLEVKTLPNLPARDTAVDRLLNTNSLYKSLNSTLKDWFYWTNYSRKNPRRFWDSVVAPIVNLYPETKDSYSASLQKDLFNAASLPLLQPNKTLLNTSYTLAKDLADQKASPSHTSPSGMTFSERMKSAGITNCAGENISFGPSNPVMMLVLLYLDRGVPQLGHRKSLLNPSFTEMGVGTAAYPDNNIIVIQDFGCTQSTPQKS